MRIKSKLLLFVHSKTVFIFLVPFLFLMYLFNSHVTMFTLFRFDAFLIKIKCCMTVACSIVHFKGYVNKCIYQSFFGSN